MIYLKRIIYFFLVKFIGKIFLTFIYNSLNNCISYDVEFILTMTYELNSDLGTLKNLLINPLIFSCYYK